MCLSRYDARIVERVRFVTNALAESRDVEPRHDTAKLYERR